VSFSFTVFLLGKQKKSVRLSAETDGFFLIVFKLTLDEKRSHS